MTEKRFWTSADESILDSNSLFWVNDKELTMEEVVFTLRRQQETIDEIKQTIREAYNNERTQIGRNVLKQLLEAIE